MQQHRIRELLDEASELGIAMLNLEDIGAQITGTLRLWEIRKELHTANPLSASSAGQKILDSVLVETFLYNPAALPALFPFFAVFCGDARPGNELAAVDWRLMPHT